MSAAATSTLAGMPAETREDGRCATVVVGIDVVGPASLFVTGRVLAHRRQAQESRARFGAGAGSGG